MEKRGMFLVWAAGVDSRHAIREEPRVCLYQWHQRKEGALVMMRTAVLKQKMLQHGHNRQSVNYLSRYVLVPLFLLSLYSFYNNCSAPAKHSHVGLKHRNQNMTSRTFEYSGKSSLTRPEQ